METWLKWLIAAACVVVIAAGGYYGWAEYRESKRLEAAQAVATQNAQARREAAQKATNDAYIADCNKRVPSQSTENLKSLYQKCLADYGLD